MSITQTMPKRRARQIRTNIYLTNEMVQELRQEADLLGVTMAEVVRAQISAWMSRKAALRGDKQRIVGG